MGCRPSKPSKPTPLPFFGDKPLLPLRPVPQSAERALRAKMGWRLKREAFKQGYIRIKATDSDTEVWEPIEMPMAILHSGYTMGQGSMEASYTGREPVEDNRFLNVRAPKLKDAPKTVEQVPLFKATREGLAYHRLLKARAPKLKAAPKTAEQVRQWKVARRGSVYELDVRP